MTKVNFSLHQQQRSRSAWQHNLHYDRSWKAIMMKYIEVNVHAEKI